MKTKQKKTEKQTDKNIAEASSKCNDRDCPVHGNLSARGRSFEGRVVSKFPRRITIEFERMVYFKKYERYAKMKTKIHARLPKCMEKNIHVGDFVKVQQCRPLSKIIHFVVVKKLKNKEDKK